MAAPIYRGGRPFIKPGIRTGNNTGVFNTSSAPTDGTSGTLVGVAGPGSILMRTNGAVYVNTNTKASPTWVSLGVGATNAALTTPTITGGTESAMIHSDAKSLAATQTADANVTPAALTGFSWTLVAGATYNYEMGLATTCTTVGGFAISYVLTTATLTSIAYNAVGIAAASVTASKGTTTTSATKVFDSKAAIFLNIKVTGSLVVNAGGTFAWAFCQNTSAGTTDASLVLLNSTARFTRVL
jgi:hypothetical protein